MLKIKKKFNKIDIIICNVVPLKLVKLGMKTEECGKKHLIKFFQQRT